MSLLSTAKQYIKSFLAYTGLLEYFLPIYRRLIRRSRPIIEAPIRLSLDFLLSLRSSSYEIIFDGSKIEFPVYDYYTYRWFNRYSGKTFSGWHEPSVTRFFEQILDRADTFLDCGAHLGYYSFLFASRKGKTSYAIELDPVNFEYLKRFVNDTKGYKGTVYPYNLGISNRKSTAHLNVTRPSPEKSLHHVAKMGKNDQQTVPVEIVTIDDFVFHECLEPDVVKIDVEGGEWGAWQGCQETIRRFRPILIIEIHKKPLMEHGVDVSEFFDQIRKAGYDLFSFPSLRSTMPEELEKITQPKSDRNYDIVCIPA